LRLLFIDFKQDCDLVNGTYLSEILKELREPKKLVKLLRMTLQDSDGKIKLQVQMSEAFGTERGLRKGDASLQHCLIL